MKKQRQSEPASEGGHIWIKGKFVYITTPIEDHPNPAYGLVSLRESEPIVAARRDVFVGQWGYDFLHGHRG